MCLVKLTYQGEELLEPLFRWLRFRAGQKYYTGHKRILDFGCGPQGRFVDFLTRRRIKFTEYVGFDPLAKRSVKQKQALLTPMTTDIKGTFDLVTMFAVLEHVDYPDFDFSFLRKHTRPGSILIVTTPSPFGKIFLEHLFYPLGLISKREIDEHQHYYSKFEVRQVFESCGFVSLTVKNFTLGMNTLGVFVRS